MANKLIKIGLLFSLTGTTSVTERGEYEAALLAISQINDMGGIHGRELVPVAENISSDPLLASQKAEKLLREDGVDAIVGLYTSACRKAVIPVLEKYRRLLFYPALYEGEELCPYIFYCGPVPNQQLQDFLPWLMNKFGPSFYLIGSDYVYPRETNKHIRRLLSTLNGNVVGESYVSLGIQRFQQLLQDIREQKPDVVFSTLVGDSAVSFYQQFYKEQLNIPIASSITAETEIAEIGIPYAKGHFTSFPYFSSINSTGNKSFRNQFRLSYGTDVVSFVMESAYYSVWLLAKAIERAKSTQTDDLRKALSGMSFDAPQGTIQVDYENQHLWLHSRIGQIDDSGEFDIVWTADGLIAPSPFQTDTAQTTGTERQEDVSCISLKEVEMRLSKISKLITSVHKIIENVAGHFMILSEDSIVLFLQSNDDDNALSPLPPFIKPGLKVTKSMMGNSGLTLGLESQSQAVVWGKNHERPELYCWVSIGIPIRNAESEFVGIIGAFLPKIALTEDSLSIITGLLNVLVKENGILEKQKRDATENQTLVGSLMDRFQFGYLIVQNTRIIAVNHIGRKLLDNDKLLLRKILSQVIPDNYVNGKWHFDIESNYLFEVTVSKDNNLLHISFQQAQNVPSDRTVKSSSTPLIGRSAAFRKNLKLQKLAADIDTNVLILGESGTGKELFSRKIHDESNRHEKPFIAVNCAALSAELLNAELFGYVEGAFTGAKRGGNIGKFEAANGGTLFLDEIGDMPIEQQGVLLRALQEREILRVGGTQPIKVDVRIIAATNQNLSQEIAFNGAFRSDLYYRLNVFSIELAPLRQRSDDIPELAEYFIHKLSVENQVQDKHVENEAVTLLQTYSWPGNIRELQNVIERSFYLAGDSITIGIEYLPDFLKTEGSKTEYQPTLGFGQQTSNLQEIRHTSMMTEKETIHYTLLKHKGNISRAARELDMSRTTLYRKLRSHNLY